MNLIELDFEQAKARHILFKTNLRSMLYGAVMDEKPVLSHEDCAVGKWIYDHALQQYGHVPEMIELEKVHASIHQLAQVLVTRYKNGQVDEAREGLADMETIASQLMVLLSTVEQKILGEEKSAHRHAATDQHTINYKELLELHTAIQQLDERIREQTALSQTARKQVQENEQKFQLAVKQAPVGITILRGPDYIVEMANETYLEIIGSTEEAFVGKPLFTSLPETAPFIGPVLQQVMQTGVPFNGNEFEILLHRPGKQQKSYFNFVYQPLREIDASITGIMVVATEVTELVRSQERLRESEDRLRLATEGTQLATWDLNLQTNEIIYSSRLSTIFGYDESKKLTLQELRGHLHPDDVYGIVEEASKESLQTGLYNYEARIVRADQEVRWIKTSGKIIFDEQHHPLRMLGTVMDITDDRNKEEQVAKLAAIVTSSDDAIIGKRLDGIVTSWNSAAERIFGYTAAEMIGQPISKLVPPDRMDEEIHILEELKKGRRVNHIETLRVTKDHRLLDISLTISPVKDSNGRIIGASKIARDISAQKRAERLFNDNAERLQIVINASGLGTFEMDLKNREIAYSPRYIEMLGYSSDEAPNYSELAKHIHPEDQHMRTDAFEEAYRTGVLQYVSRLVWRDGSIHWIEAKGKVFYDEQQQPYKIIGISRDLTEEKSYQHRIEESEKRFRAVADTAPVMIWMADTDLQCTFLNKAWLEFTGHSIDEDRNDGWIANIHPEDRKRIINDYQKAATLQDEFLHECRLKRYDGEYRWVSNNATPRFTPDGIFEGYVGACMDIHERILFEEKLKASESRLRIAALSSELGTWEYIPSIGELTWDNASRDLFGLDAETPITLDLFWSKMHPDDREAALEKMLRALDPSIADTYDAEYRIFMPDNKIRWIHGKGKAFFDEEHMPYLFSGTVLDITEKRAALQELQENEQKFRLLADFMPQFIWTGDASGNLNYFNQAVYAFSGLTPQKIAEEGWLEIVHPDDRAENIRLWLDCMETGAPFLYEHRFRRHDGAYRWQLSRAIPQRDADGHIQMWVGTSTDIHDRKLFTDELEMKVEQRTSELKQLNEDLVRSNDELAQFAYVASHDLQEPLRKIQTFASRVMDLEMDNLSEKGKDYFTRMNAASMRMQQLILDLLSYSRSNTLEQHFEHTDLNKLLDTVKEQLNETIEQHHTVFTGNKLPTVQIIPYQVEQVFTNLITNAIKFAKAGQAVQISITAAVLQGKDADCKGLEPLAAYHHLAISDNGIGFDAQYSERIFHVFQRLHGRDEYSGTGIGLAICRKNIENNFGCIVAESSLGNGATFHIYLPVDITANLARKT